MTEMLFVFLLKLYFNFHSFHQLAVTDTVCFFLPSSFTGAFFLFIYEYIKAMIDFDLLPVQSVF